MEHIGKDKDLETANIDEQSKGVPGGKNMFQKFLFVIITGIESYIVYEVCAGKNTGLLKTTGGGIAFQYQMLVYGMAFCYLLG